MWTCDALSYCVIFLHIGSILHQKDLQPCHTNDKKHTINLTVIKQDQWRSTIVIIIGHAIIFWDLRSKCTSSGFEPQMGEKVTIIIVWNPGVENMGIVSSTCPSLWHVIPTITVIKSKNPYHHHQQQQQQPWSSNKPRARTLSITVIIRGGNAAAPFQLPSPKAGSFRHGCQLWLAACYTTSSVGWHLLLQGTAEPRAQSSDLR